MHLSARIRCVLASIVALPAESPVTNMMFITILLSRLSLTSSDAGCFCGVGRAGGTIQKGIEARDSLTKVIRKKTCVCDLKHFALTTPLLRQME